MPVDTAPLDPIAVIAYDGSSCIGCGRSTVGRGPVPPDLCPACAPAPPRVGDFNEDPGEEERAMLRLYMPVLGERAQQIVEARWLDQRPTFKAIGRMFEVNGSRAQHVYVKAVAELRRAALAAGLQRSA